MKALVILLILLGTNKSFTQPLNYCDYFSLEFTERENGNKNNLYFHIDVNRKRKTVFGRFVKAHDIRFKYLLLKFSDKLQDIKQLYPDTALIAERFCNEIIRSDSVQLYFSALTPNNLTTWDLRNDSFTTQEMMEVASSFFYCHGVNESDTTIMYKICIGIHGENEGNSSKDLLLLEAFTIEAILFYMSKNKIPDFYSDFENFLQIQTSAKRKEFKDFDSYLKEIRQMCYLEMQRNTDLKKKLVEYYQTNKRNLNFEIR